MIRKRLKCRPAHSLSMRDERINITNEGTPGSLLGISTDRRAELEQQKIIGRST